MYGVHRCECDIRYLRVLTRVVPAKNSRFGCDIWVLEEFVRPAPTGNSRARVFAMSRNVPTSHMACFQFSYNTTFLLLSYLNSNWMSSVLLKKFSSRDVWLACGSSCVCINCCIPCAACFSSTTRSVTRNLIGTKYKLGNGVRSVSQVVYFGKTRLIIPKVPLARRGHLNIVQVRVSCVSYIFPPLS